MTVSLVIYLKTISEISLLSTFNDTTYVAYRSDSSSEPPDPRGGKQPRPVPGGHHHWKTERISSLRTSTGEPSVSVERGWLNAPSVTPQHLSLYWQIEQWQTAVPWCPSVWTLLHVSDEHTLVLQVRSSHIASADSKFLFDSSFPLKLFFRKRLFILFSQ